MREREGKKETLRCDKQIEKQEQPLIENKSKNIEKKILINTQRWEKICQKREYIKYDVQNKVIVEHLLEIE